MEPLNFAYWLRGYLELAKPTKLNAEQIQEINNHLDLVLKKVTPNNAKTLPKGLKHYEKDQWILPASDCPNPFGVSFNQETCCSC